jgi:hypothetical protein
MFKFKKIPFLSFTILRKLKSNSVDKIFLRQLSSLYIFKNLNVLYLYNGLNYKKIKFSNLHLFYKIGSLILTRKMNFGKILHARKKVNLTKKK